MYYDYKSIFTVDDIYLQNDHSSLINPPNVNSNLSLASQSQLMALYKKNISAYLIMRKIAKKDSKTYHQLLQKLKHKSKQNDIISMSPYPILNMEDTIKDNTNDYLLINDIVGGIIKKNKKEHINIYIKESPAEDVIQSEPDQRKKPRKSIKKNKKQADNGNKSLNKQDLIKQKMQITEPYKTKIIEKSAIESERIEAIMKKLKKRGFRLKNPKNHKPIMQDFNDYYCNYSDDDRQKDSEKDEELTPEEQDILLSQILQGSPDMKPEQSEENLIEDIENNHETSEDLVKSQDNDIDDIHNNDELLINSSSLSIKKEVSFHPSEKNSPISPHLSPKKSRSISRTKTLTSNKTPQKNDVNEDIYKDDVLKHKEEDKNGPYIGIIEKLLKSNDLFAEDIDGLMGVKKVNNKLPEDLKFIDENDKKIYEEIYKWSGHMDGLLKKDQKEIKRYKKKMEIMFQNLNNEEQKIENSDESGESSEEDEESEEG